MKQLYGLDRVILNSDKGHNSGNNLTYLVKRGDSYEYNKSGTFKVKSFLRDRKVKDESGEEVELHEKVFCFWSKDYDDREKHKRGELKKKAEHILGKSLQVQRFQSLCLKKYLKLNHVNEETEEIEKIKPFLEYDKKRYARDQELDGYYVLISSKVELLEAEIIEKYRGLWKIEESF